MTLADEALAYWKASKKYRGAFSKAGAAYVAHHEIPTLQLRVKSQHIINQLHNIMSLEGVINYDEDQSADPSA